MKHNNTAQQARKKNKHKGTQSSTTHTPSSPNKHKQKRGGNIQLGKQYKSNTHTTKTQTKTTQSTHKNNKQTCKHVCKHIKQANTHKETYNNNNTKQNKS